MLEKSKICVIFFCLFIMAVLSISILTPPMQSPDEGEHIFRAYALKDGKVILKKFNDKVGAPVDTGLFKYQEITREIIFQPDAKYSKEMFDRQKNIKYTDRAQFVEMPNMAVYLPLNYLPQALALGVGKLFDMEVYKSYYLARLFSFFMVLFLLGVAFYYQKPNFFVLSLLFMPMSLFQFASASADGVLFGLMVLIMSLFSYQWQQEKIEKKVLYMISGLMFVLCANRMNMIPMTLFLGVLWYKFKDRRCLWCFLATVGAILGWIVLMALMVKTRGNTGVLEVLGHYISHPKELGGIFYNTLSNPERLRLYRNSFIGQLGWLDTLLNISVIIFLGVSLCVIFGINLCTSQKALTYATLGISLCCVFSVFLCVLIYWGEFISEKAIEGVQGRYFIPVAIMLGYGLCQNACNRIRYLTSMGLFFIFALVSYVATVWVLLLRYWLS